MRAGRNARGRGRLALCMLGLLQPCLGVASSTAQEQPRPPTFRRDANYVRVDVYPTRGGVSATDLRQDDFEVLEDKVPQRIEQFEHVTIRAAGPQDARREP